MHDLMNQHKLFLTGARKVLYFRWPRMNSPQLMSDDDTKRYIFKHFIHFKESCNIFFFVSYSCQIGSLWGCSAALLPFSASGVTTEVFNFLFLPCLTLTSQRTEWVKKQMLKKISSFLINNLSCLPCIVQPCLQTEVKFTSGAARDLLLKKTKSTAVGPESKPVRNFSTMPQWRHDNIGGVRTIQNITTAPLNSFCDSKSSEDTRTRAE